MGTSQPPCWFFSLTGQEWALGEVCWSVISNCHPYNGDYNTPGATLNDPNCHCALKNSCWPSPRKVLSCTEGGQLWRCFKWLHNYVRRMAACHGVVSWFCKFFEAMRHFRPPQKHVSAAGHWQWHEIKAPFDPQPTSTALGLQAVQRLEVRGTARSRRQAGPKTHENGLGGPLPFHSQDGQETASRGTGSINTHKHASPLMSTRTVREFRQRASSAGDIVELHVWLQAVISRTSAVMESNKRLTMLLLTSCCCNAKADGPFLKTFLMIKSVLELHFLSSREQLCLLWIPQTHSLSKYFFFLLKLKYHPVNHHSLCKSRFTSNACQMAH